MKKWKPSTLFKITFLFFYITYAIPYTQVIPYLKDVGYSVVERGWILAVMAIMAMVGQIIFGYLVDKLHKLKILLYGVTIVVIGIVYLCYLKTESALFFHVLVISSLGGLFRVAMGLVDQWVLDSDQADNYGKIRCYGAIGWAIGSPLASFLLKGFGYWALTLSYAIMTIGSIWISHYLEDMNRKGESQIHFQDIGKLLKNKRYVLLLVIYVCIFFVATADGYTVVEKMLEIGATNQQVAYKWMLQSLAEIPLFYYSTKLVAKIGAKKLLLIGTALHLVRFACYAIATSPLQIILFSSLQMVTFPLVIVAGKILFQEETPKKLKATGQMLALAMYYGLAALLTPLACGYLVDFLGYDITLWILAIFIIVPTGLVVYYQKLKNKDEKLKEVVS